MTTNPFWRVQVTLESQFLLVGDHVRVRRVHVFRWGRGLLLVKGREQVKGAREIDGVTMQRVMVGVALKHFKGRRRRRYLKVVRVVRVVRLLSKGLRCDLRRKWRRQAHAVPLYHLMACHGYGGMAIC
jgi:hypothetical protein